MFLFSITRALNEICNSSCDGTHFRMYIHSFHRSSKDVMLTHLKILIHFIYDRRTVSCFNFLFIVYNLMIQRGLSRGHFYYRKKLLLFVMRRNILGKFHYCCKIIHLIFRIEGICKSIQDMISIFLTK